LRLSAAVALVGLGSGGSLATTATKAITSVHPVPASAGHVLSTALSFPPDTAWCVANLKRPCYEPAQFQKAYNLQPLFDKKLDGTGQTIVIVDSFGSPTIREDLKKFDLNYGLPDPPSFEVIEPAGKVAPFPQDPFGVDDRVGWAAETTLDVEYSHVFAPGAKILLVATPTSEVEGVQGFPEIVKAENYVIEHHLGSVISQSFGATEETFPNRDSLLALRSAFFNARRNHVTVLGSSGDAGATDLLPDTSCCYPFRVNSWPSADPLVTSIGGTELHLDAAGNRTAPDSVWNDQPVRGIGRGVGGGGQSKVFERPGFQDNVEAVVGDARGTPDISMSAATVGAAIVYWSFCTDGSTAPAPPCPQWRLIGGTSESSPEFAGIVAIANQAAGHQLGWLNPKLYQLKGRASGIVDVTTGNNTYTFCSTSCGTPTEVDITVKGFNAAPGYDMASGVGTIDAAKFVAALAGQGDHEDDRAATSRVG
jgi:subtilase family serine protease